MTGDEVIERVQDLLERMRSLLETNGASGWRTTWDIVRNDIWDFAQRTFEKDSTEYSIVRSALNPRSALIYGSEWQNFYGTYGDPVERALVVLQHRLEKGQTILLQGEPTAHLIEPGTPHSAYVFLRDIFQAAFTQVFLIDPYVDGSLFSLISNVKASAKTRILTRKQNLPADFAEELRRFVQEKGISVELRVGLQDIHDRFLVIDDRLFFSGASFKDLGKKASVVGEIKDIKEQILNQLEEKWNSASELK